MVAEWDWVSGTVQELALGSQWVPAGVIGIPRSPMGSTTLLRRNCW